MFVLLADLSDYNTRYAQHAYYYYSRKVYILPCAGPKSRFTSRVSCWELEVYCGIM